MNADGLRALDLFAEGKLSNSKRKIRVKILVAHLLEEAPTLGESMLSPAIRSLIPPRSPSTSSPAESRWEEWQSLDRSAPPAERREASPGWRRRSDFWNGIEKKFIC